jgi:hypothetical protein
MRALVLWHSVHHPHRATLIHDTHTLIAHYDTTARHNHDLFFSHRIRLLRRGDGGSR